MCIDAVYGSSCFTGEDDECPLRHSCATAGHHQAIFQFVWVTFYSEQGIVISNRLLFASKFRGFRPVAIGGEAIGLLALTQKARPVTAASISVIAIYRQLDNLVFVIYLRIGARKG